MRDSSGILWLGSQDGLFRYDGSKLAEYNSDREGTYFIPDGDIRGIVEGVDGDIFVASYGAGLMQLSSGTTKFSARTDFGAYNLKFITRLTGGADGRLWLGNSRKLVLFDPNYGSSRAWALKDDLEASIGGFRALATDSSGDLIVGGENGLKKFRANDNNVEGIFPHISEWARQSTITALFLFNQHLLFIGTDKGLIISLDLQTGKVLSRQNISLDKEYIVSDFLLYKSDLFIATDKGLFASDLELSFIEDVSDNGKGLNSRDVYRLYDDGEFLLAGTFSGVNAARFTPFEYFNTKNSGVSDQVMDFEEDSIGSLWVATYDGLFFFNSASETHERYELLYGEAAGVLANQRVTSIASHESFLWLGFFSGGVQKLDTSTGALSTPKISGLKDLSVIDLFYDAEHSQLWIASYNRGLVRYSRGRSTFFFDEGLLLDKVINFVFKARNNDIYVATLHGLYRFEPLTDQFENLEMDFGTSGLDPLIYSIAQSNSGDIYLGTKRHGVYVWPYTNQQQGDVNIQQLGKNDDLKHTNVYGIEIDHAGHLWMATENGISRFDPETSLVSKYDTTHGLQDRDFSFGASFQNNKGDIFFGGARGYNRFNPGLVSNDREPPRTVITDVAFPSNNVLDVVRLVATKRVLLSHKDYYVSFVFGTSGLAATGSTKFRYMLKGLDDHWIYGKSSNSVTYTNVPPGNYLFLVQGANSSGIWDPIGASIAVEVLPPPWRTWWAYSLYFITLAFLFWCIHRIYHSYAIDRKASLLAKEMFEAEERAEDDRQEMQEYQDELIKAAFDHKEEMLALIADCFKRSEKSVQSKDQQHPSLIKINCVDALSILEKCTYYRADGPVANLNSFVDAAVPKLLRSASVGSETIVTINETPDRLIPTDVASPLAVIIYELLSNSFRYAFHRESPINYVLIHLDLERMDNSLKHWFRLVVKDSGRGIEDSLTDQPTSGSGLAVVGAIADRLGGEVKVSNEDGTKVTVRLPALD